jgi:hypothetical protein
VKKGESIPLFKREGHPAEAGSRSLPPFDS